ncbi:rhamnose ABC transporter substrate-binding protein, partial [Cohnella sp. AR92]
MKKIMALGLTAVLSMSLLAACGNNSNDKAASGGDAKPSSSAASGNTGDKQKFAIIFKNTGNPYGEKQMEGFKKAIEENGDEAILK